MVSCLLSVSALAWPFVVINKKVYSVSDLLDGFNIYNIINVIIPRQPSREDLLVRRPKSVKTIESTVRLHRAGTPARDISIAFYLSSFLLV